MMYEIFESHFSVSWPGPVVLFNGNQNMVTLVYLLCLPGKLFINKDRQENKKSSFKASALDFKYFAITFTIKTSIIGRAVLRFWNHFHNLRFTRC